MLETYKPGLGQILIDTIFILFWWQMPVGSVCQIRREKSAGKFRQSKGSILNGVWRTFLGRHFTQYFFHCKVKTAFFGNTIWPRFVYYFFPHRLPGLFVGGDTVISSCTWKTDSQKRYYFNLCRIFTKKKKDLFLKNPYLIFTLGIFPPLLFPSQKETCLTQVSNAFSFCNFVYWFSIYVYIGLFL